MARLPQPGSDDGTWGDILNQYLLTSHNSDGVLRDGAVPAGAIQDDAVTPAKLSAANTPISGQVLSYNGSSFTWVTAGSTDHGGLTGLADDDHPQYHTDARGDVRYYTKAQVDTALGNKADTSTVTAIDSRVTTLESYNKVLVLGPSDPVPGGTPAGTVIVRTS